jgi:hypothetical protein
MSADSFDIAAGAARVRVTGVKQLASKLRKTGADMSQLTDAMRAAGQAAARAAAPLAPTLTGRLAASVRAGAARTKAVVRAGGAGVPYAGVIHYGWPARNIEPHPFLISALQQTRPQVLAALDQAVTRIIKENNL